MPGVEEYKLIQPGASLAVTIPSPLAKYHNLKKGDKVKVFFDNIVVVIPKQLEEKILSDPEKRRALEVLLE
jgi:antitoxin component of MazEF toxin-antitoxin module